MASFGWVIVNGQLQFSSNITVNGTITLSGAAGSSIALSNPSNGNLTVAGDLTSTANIALASSGAFTWSTRTQLSSSATGLMLMTTNAGTAGVAFDVVTDGTYKVRSRAQADTAILDVSRYSAGGTLGVVTFGPAAVVSITVKGGIITAIS